MEHWLKMACLMIIDRVNSFQPSVAFHIETSHLFCRAKQVTGFYMIRSTGLKWVKLGCAVIFIKYLVSVMPLIHYSPMLLFYTH